MPLPYGRLNILVQSYKRLYPNITVELVHFNTKGDRILEKPLAQVGGKGLFTAELEEAMHKGRY